jgi:hypothetical protein
MTSSVALGLPQGIGKLIAWEQIEQRWIRSEAGVRFDDVPLHNPRRQRESLSDLLMRQPFIKVQFQDFLHAEWQPTKGLRQGLITLTHFYFAGRIARRGEFLYPRRRVRQTLRGAKRPFGCHVRGDLVQVAAWIIDLVCPGVSQQTEEDFLRKVIEVRRSTTQAQAHSTAQRATKVVEPARQPAPFVFCVHDPIAPG